MPKYDTILSKISHSVLLIDMFKLNDYKMVDVICYVS